MEIKVVANPDKEQVDIFEKFADENWGEHSHDGDSDLDFFDLHRLLFTLVDEGKTLSGLVVMFKTVLISNKAVLVGGIGGVVTDLNQRRKGYALRVLMACNDYLKNLGVDVVMLCTEIERLGNLYGKAGFEVLGKPYYYLDKNETKKQEDGGMFLLLSNKISKEGIMDKNQEIFVGRSNF